MRPYEPPGDDRAMMHDPNIYSALLAMRRGPQLYDTGGVPPPINAEQMVRQLDMLDTASMAPGERMMVNALTPKGQSPSYGFQDRSVQNPYAQMLGPILDALQDPRTQAQLAPGMALLKAPQSLYNASRVLPNLFSERGSMQVPGWPGDVGKWAEKDGIPRAYEMLRSGGYLPKEAPKTVDAQGNMTESAHAWARNLLDRWTQWGRMREEAIQSGMPAEQADEALRYMNMNPIGYDETMALKKVIPDQN